MSLSPSDQNFLLVLGIGFTLLTLLRVFTLAFRSWVIVYLRTILKYPIKLQSLSTLIASTHGVVRQTF